MEHTQHITRAVLLLIATVIVFATVRHFAVPDTFGDHGHYRFASVAEIAAKTPMHGGRGSCLECHADEADFAAEGPHRSISCEACHAPLGTHVVAGDVIAEMRTTRTHALCALCHQRLAARPPTFPQVHLAAHVVDKGGELTAEICLECHDAHDPSE
ncbi:MAG: cytochrome C [Planctomycetota bacterium]|jgi:hypothetical protein